MRARAGGMRRTDPPGHIGTGGEQPPGPSVTVGKAPGSQRERSCLIYSQYYYYVLKYVEYNKNINIMAPIQAYSNTVNSNENKDNNNHLIIIRGVGFLTVFTQLYFISN